VFICGLMGLPGKNWPNAAKDRDKCKTVVGPRLTAQCKSEPLAKTRRLPSRSKESEFDKGSVVDLAAM